MMSSILSHHNCVFYRQECFLAEVSTMTSTANYFCHGDLLVKVSMDTTSRFKDVAKPYFEPTANGRETPIKSVLSSIVLPVRAFSRNPIIRFLKKILGSPKTGIVGPKWPKNRVLQGFLKISSLVKKFVSLSKF